MRVLVASNVFPPNFIGGAELIAHYQAKALQRAGHEVEVFAGEIQAFGNHHDARHEVWDGIPVTRISMLPRDYEPGFVNFSHPPIERRFREVLERFRPEVFHAHNLIGLSAALPALAREAGAATVVTLHDHWGYCFKNTIIKEGTTVCRDFSRCAECQPVIDDGAARAIPIRFRKDFVRLMLSEVDTLVSPSRYLAESYVRAGYPRERMHVVWNGIDIARFDAIARKPAPGELRLTYLGILAPHKGVQTLMEALGHLPPGAPVRVNLVGDGESAPLYRQILERNGRAEHVRFWGRLDPSRVGEAFAETDVLVLPSIWPENQPVSITEAMACHVPAIVSNMGGMLELVQDGVSGDVFQAGDVRDLAMKIEGYLADPSRAARLGAVARQRIEGHSFDRQVERLLEVYEQAGVMPREAPTARLVACIGERVGPESAEAAEVLGDADDWRFVMKEWLPPSWAGRCRLEWLADARMPWSQVLSQLGGKPALADVRNREARGLWESRRALFFYDSAQAVQAVRRLEADEAVHAELARRAASAQTET